MLKVQFSPPDMTEEEVAEVKEAILSGWITTGPKTKEFERKIAEYCNVNRAVCLNSQTACAEMSLRVLGVGEGDEVIVPAYTYTATASVVCHVGAELKMVDIQKDSLEMDYDALEDAITERTKVIIPVDLGGVPCDYDRIFEIVEKKKELFHPNNEIQRAMGRISVNTDAAHAFGAKWHGKMVGSIADFTSFSFHAVKNLTTAEGGALTWKSIPGINDEEIYKKLQLSVSYTHLDVYKRQVKKVSERRMLFQALILGLGVLVVAFILLFAVVSIQRLNTGTEVVNSVRTVIATVAMLVLGIVVYVARRKND